MAAVGRQCQNDVYGGSGQSGQDRSFYPADIEAQDQEDLDQESGTHGTEAGAQIALD